MAVDVEPKQLRIQFFEYLFGATEEGYVCIASSHKEKGGFKESFFMWPLEKAQLSTHIDSLVADNNVWFCVSFLDAKSRMKEHCRSNTFAWADLDEANPDGFPEGTPAPTAVLETSPGRFQGFWRFYGTSVPSDLIEDYSRRLTYHTDADKGGWSRNKLLRVPWTKNFKYDDTPQVKLLTVSSDQYDVKEFDKLIPTIGESQSDTVIQPPETLPQLDHVLYRYQPLDDEFRRLYSITPDDSADWSRILWRFINKLFEMKMAPEEVYVVALNAACNKYKRDNRPEGYLWRDVLKADQDHQRYESLTIQGQTSAAVVMPHLVDFDEFEEDSFIKMYKTWALEATDAPEQYHELGVFILLSAICSSGLFLELNWGKFYPNLWGLVLGESTLTRKTTAMRLVVDTLKGIDDDLILATDGSAEGLLTGLSHRPKRVSIYWKDEVSGLFDSINRKDYLAGLPETLTQLYDVPQVLTRLLRKETVSISEPYFIFFGGGIRDKVYSLLSDEYVLSGFLPRFLVVSGENDLSRVRRTGPPTNTNTERKDNLISELCDIRDRFDISVPITVAGQQAEIKSQIEARLTSGAWETYQSFEDKLTTAGVDSDHAMLVLPTFTRLSFSLLKMALLVAASRRTPDDDHHLIVEQADVKQAAFYIEKWGHYSIDLMLNTGVTQNEKLIKRAQGLVVRRPGITKAEFMQRLRLSARDAKELIETMSQRGLIDPKQAGRGMRIYPLTGEVQ